MSFYSFLTKILSLRFTRGLKCIQRFQLNFISRLNKADTVLNVFSYLASR